MGLEVKMIPLQPGRRFSDDHTLMLAGELETSE